MQTQSDPPLTFEQLAQQPEINLPVRTLRWLWHQGKIPGLVLGHRTIRFQTSKVLRALEKFEVKAVGQK